MYFNIFIFLIILVYENQSSCQNPIYNSKNNYGLSNEQFRAILFGLNYDLPNKNNIDRENVENHSLFFRNFVDDDIQINKQDEKTQSQIEIMNNEKINNSGTIHDNKNANNYSVTNGNEKPNDELLQKTLRKNKLSEKDNSYNNIQDQENITFNNSNTFHNKNNVVDRQGSDSGINENVSYNNSSTVNMNRPSHNISYNNNDKEYHTNENLIKSNLDKQYSRNTNSENIFNNNSSTNINKNDNSVFNEPTSAGDYMRTKKGTNDFKQPGTLQKNTNIKNIKGDGNPLKDKKININENKGQENVNQNTPLNNPINYMINGVNNHTEGFVKESNEMNNPNVQEQRQDRGLLHNNGSNKNMQMGHNDEPQILLNGEKEQNTKYISTNPRTIKHKEENVNYSAKKIISDSPNSRNGVLKEIQPVKYNGNINEKLNDVSKGNENLQKTNKTDENIFSENITLKNKTNDTNYYKYFKLKENGFRGLGIINKYSSKGGFSISVDCGGYNDLDDIPGISNLLHRVIFYKSKKRDTTLLSELGVNSPKYNSHINESFTNFYASGNSEDIYYLLNLFVQNLFYPIFDEKFIENEVNEISNQYISMENNPETCLKITSQYLTHFKYSNFFIYGNYITLCENILKKRIDIKEKLYAFHRKCYQPKNMSISILLGKKSNSSDHYNINDIIHMVDQLFGKITNYDEKEIIKKQNNMELKENSPNRQVNNHSDRNFTYNDAQINLNNEINTKNDMSIPFTNKLNYSLDLNQKSQYIEILKKEGWEDQIFLYWSSKINIYIYKKIEEFKVMRFFHELFSNFGKDGLYYKISVENKYAYDFQIINICNKYYLNYGILIKLTTKGKSNLAHLIYIFQTFINEISKLFDHDSLNKGVNKYMLDYYRENTLPANINFRKDDINICLNDLINYSNRLLIYLENPLEFLKINNLVENMDKNDFRNEIKITSLIGSLIRNESMHIINVVDIFTITHQIKIPNTSIEYSIGDNPYIIDEEKIANNINFTLPEFKICPFPNFKKDEILNENSFFCVSYNSEENFSYSKYNKQSFVSDDSEYVRSNILYNTPCLIKSSYGYNIFFKKGLTDTSRVNADFIFFFPSQNFTFYEAIFTRIHIIILKKKIKQLLSDYTNCSVNVNIKDNVESYILHVDSNSYYFVNMLNKIEDLLSIKEVPTSDEFSDAYDELNLYVKRKDNVVVGDSLNIIYSLFNKYIPTNKEIYDILNAYFFYPLYNSYIKYINNFFHKNYINIFIYGNLSISNAINIKNESNYGTNTEYNNNRINDNSYANNTHTMYNKHTLGKNNNVLEDKEDSIEIPQNGIGINYIIDLCESFIRNVTNNVIKKSESTYYATKLTNNEDIEIDIQIPDKNIGNSSITVSYIIESETILSDTLINIIVDLISSDFIKFAKIKYNDGYTVDVKPFSTKYGFGGIIFVIQSFDNDVERLEEDICGFVKHLTFQLMNIDIYDLIKKLEYMKKQYILNNTIVTFNQEYSTILDEIINGNECFDKKYKIVKIFDELINCPKIILNKANYILQNAKKLIFKEYKTTSTPNNVNEQVNYIHSNKKCNYSHNKNDIMSNIELSNTSNFTKTTKLNNTGPDYNVFRMNNVHKKGNYIIDVSNFLEIKKKGFVQYVIDYFKNPYTLGLNHNNYLDYKSCDDEMYKDNFQVFYNFTNDIDKIREYFLAKFSNDQETKEKCSINYEDIKKHCYDVNTEIDD
ncbi:peptidase M16, putative [Plasmodium chabaudi chabaudi]|uniref:Peptidase M16, putative n=1 Tax=Plasmodium chabaudi chabaudi TaxID=31271 RepID=A0A4V0K7Q4_PLACU|nr:peptidase M16, putative [Plasmodium chabaudi chabaudi]VTZ68786.1 peptidase M16, putative [Plasmodium chabaudi chabaudi]|eukprot:XP_733361.2 petidase, M16 family, putative [Plasmodium chabaudi chabaudi]